MAAASSLPLCRSASLCTEKLKMKRKTIHTCVIVYSCMLSMYDDVLRKLWSIFFFPFFFFSLSLSRFLLHLFFGQTFCVRKMVLASRNQPNLLFIAQHFTKFSQSFDHTFLLFHFLSQCELLNAHRADDTCTLMDAFSVATAEKMNCCFFFVFFFNSEN